MTPSRRPTKSRPPRRPMPRLLTTFFTAEEGTTSWTRRTPRGPSTRCTAGRAPTWWRPTPETSSRTIASRSCASSRFSKHNPRLPEARRPFRTPASSSRCGLPCRLFSRTGRGKLLRDRMGGAPGRYSCFLMFSLPNSYRPLRGTNRLSLPFRNRCGTGLALGRSQRGVGFARWGSAKRRRWWA